MRTYLKYLNKHYLAALIPLLVLSSCKKQDVLNPDFNATVTKTTYAVGEPITYTFSGDADLVTFYSGVTGSEYKYKDRTTVNGKPQIQFTSYYQASTQTNTLQLLVSKDFNGTFDIPDLQSATWTDITSRATLSTGSDNTASGVVDLSDFLAPNSPVYIAFKYTATSASTQPTWTVKNIAVDNVQSDSSKVSIATSANIHWGIINVLNSANLWSFSTSQIQFLTSAAGNADNEDWIIAQPLQLDRVQRAVGVDIKPSPTTKLTKYVFAGYTTPGTYTVTFEAINANKWDKKTTVKQFTITVQ